MLQLQNFWEKTEVNLHYLGLHNDFLEVTPKVYTMKEKVDKLKLL